MIEFSPVNLLLAFGLAAVLAVIFIVSIRKELK